MEIRELAARSGVRAKTIRYYEGIQLLPAAARKANGYRAYQALDLERLKLVAGARRLDFSLEEIKEILDLRDRKIAPCGVLLDQLKNKEDEIRQRIVELKALQADLKKLYALGRSFPMDDVEGKNCICHLVSEQADVDRIE